jgi:hypothetical protein
MIQKKSLYLFITWAFVLGFFFAAPALANAAGILPPATGETKSCSASSKEECGDYGINDFMVLAINVSNWILGIVGSLTLVMFIWGGVMFMISSGASDKVGQAKKIIVAAVVGLIIVFSSWLIINFSITTI